MSPRARKAALPAEISAAEFKARCLELMDRVREEGGEVVITKRGRPVARLAPVVERPASLFGALRGSVEIKGDIVSPVDVEWEAGR